MRSLIGGAALVLWCVPARAQQINGVPGSPSATISIDGKQLPPPPPKFIAYMNRINTLAPEEPFFV
ncbi:MAG: hypothetical protein ACLPM8_18005 [Myxococcaceae bacterium]